MRPLAFLLPATLGAALMLGAAGALPASAQTLPSAERVRGGMFDASDPSGIVRFMERTGYRVTLGTDSRGDPVINGRIKATDYIIQFYECESGQFCNSIQFLAQAPKPALLTYEGCNAFNARWRYVRLTIDQGLVRMQLDVNLDAGVTADNFEDTLDIWKQLIEVYERDILGLKSG